MREKALDWFKADAPDFDKVPEKPGIYIISTKQTDHVYDVKYVGQAENLKARVNEHWSKKESNKELKLHIAEKFLMKFNYAIIDSKSERDGLELFLFEYFKPPYNNNTPHADTPIHCTIPAVRKPEKSGV